MTKDEYKPKTPVLIEDIQTSACERSMRICGTTDGECYQKSNKMYYAIVILDEKSAKRLKTYTREYPLMRLVPIKGKEI
jgi:hypothetical protein